MLRALPGQLLGLRLFAPAARRSCWPSTWPTSTPWALSTERSFCAYSRRHAVAVMHDALVVGPLVDRAGPLRDAGRGRAPPRRRAHSATGSASRSPPAMHRVDVTAPHCPRRPAAAASVSALQDSCDAVSEPIGAHRSQLLGGRAATAAEPARRGGGGALSSAAISSLERQDGDAAAARTGLSTSCTAERSAWPRSCAVQRQRHADRFGAGLRGSAR